jgi:hypothetical protein
MFIRLWAIGAFALVASLIGLIAKVNWQDTQAFPVGLILPMSNILVGLLLAGTAIILVVAIVCRRRFA